MCESTVYSTKGEKILEDVISIKINGGKIEIKDILERKMELKGKLVEIDLEGHQIVIEINDFLTILSDRKRMKMGKSNSNNI